MPKPEHQFQYQAIAKELKGQILRGEFRHDDRLPSERLLGERFRVQRNTIRQALSLLAEEGYIAVEEKRGSFVRLPVREPSRRVIVVSIHTGSSTHLVHLLEGISHTAVRAGYSVRRFNSDPPAGGALDPIPRPESLGEDTAGVLIWPQNPTNIEALSRLQAAMPIVLVDRRVAGISADCVRFDDIAGGRMVAEHLINQGHRRIGFLTDDVFAETVQHRWHGYVLAMEQRGVPVDPSLSMFWHGLHEDLFALTLRHLLARGKDGPTAVICSNDIVAFRLLRFLRDEGVRVPDDVAVTGYGNSVPDFSEAMDLTSVDQPFDKLGEAASNILISRFGMTASDRLKSAEEIVIPVRLVVRGSSTAK